VEQLKIKFEAITNSDYWKC